VNSHNNWYWSAENPKLIYGLAVYDEKFDFWCAISDAV
jgi:hypothetical protein